MNSDGIIKRGSPEMLKSLGFHMPLEEHEASKLSVMDKSLRLAALAKMRHEDYAERKRAAMEVSIRNEAKEGCGTFCPSIKERFKERK
jgi:hypothetical protein